MSKNGDDASRTRAAHAARARADDARELRAGCARRLPGDLRRDRRGGPEALGQGREHLPVTRVLPDDLGTARAVRTYLLRQVHPGQGQQGLARLAVLRRGRRRASGRRLLRLLGRVDDVINVAGHRLGTKELESAEIMVNEVAEAAAVPVIDEVRGKIVEMYVALKPGPKPATTSRRRSRRRSSRRSGRSPARRTCGSSPTCRRPAQARSCAG